MRLASRVAGASTLSVVLAVITRPCQGGGGGDTARAHDAGQEPPDGEVGVASCQLTAQLGHASDHADVDGLSAWGDCKVAIDPTNMFMTAGGTSGPIPGISIALRPDAAVEVELGEWFVLTQVDAIVVLDTAAAENRDALEWLATEQAAHTSVVLAIESGMARLFPLRPRLHHAVDTSASSDQKVIRAGPVGGVARLHGKPIVGLGRTRMLRLEVEIEALGGGRDAVPPAGLALQLHFRGTKARPDMFCPLSSLYSDKVYQHSQNKLSPANAIKANKGLRCNLRRVVDGFDRWGVRYAMSAGTMIAAYRNGEFITWDDDIDIRVHKDDWAKLQRGIVADGKEVTIDWLREHAGGGRTDPDNYSRVWEVTGRDGQPYYWKEYLEADWDDAQKGRKYTDPAYPQIIDHPGDPGEPTKIPVVYFNTFCPQEYNVNGVLPAKVDIIISNHKSCCWNDQTENLFGQPTVRSNFGGVMVAMPPYDAADRILSEMYAPASPGGDWRKENVVVNPCTNRFLDRKMSTDGIVRVAAFALAMLVLVVYTLPLPLAHTVHYIIATTLAFGLGGLLTFGTPAFGRPVCGLAFVLVGAINSVGFWHDQALRSPDGSATTKAGPPPAWLGWISSIGLAKCVATGAILLLVVGRQGNNSVTVLLRPLSAVSAVACGVIYGLDRLQPRHRGGNVKEQNKLSLTVDIVVVTAYLAAGLVISLLGYNEEGQDAIAPHDHDWMRYFLGPAIVAGAGWTAMRGRQGYMPAGQRGFPPHDVSES